MRRTFFVSVAIVMALLAAGCSDDKPARSEAAEAGSSSTTTPAATTATTAATATTAVPAADPCALRPQAPPTGTLTANNATALAFAPDGRLFFAERSGAVRVFQDGAVKEFAKVPTVTSEKGGGYSERGLLGLAISPTFAADRFVYAFVSHPDREHQDIVRWTDCAGTGGAFTTLVRLPAGNDCCHKGGRLAFGPDGKLYATLGEEHVPSSAQNTKDPRGKVLRYNPDGTVPADNPFGAGNPVWAFGFRNPFGLAISPTGQMAVTSNGPSGDADTPATGFDIVFDNVKAGTGYQWPRCYGYSHPVPGQTSCGAGQVEPSWSSETTTVIPTGMAFVDASGPAGMAGRLVFCNYNGGMLILTPGTPHATVTKGPAECRLDVTQGPDHAVYYSDAGHIYRR
ncbi:MAG: PQQ-dependent sugar dehydrogenase [Acidimicrobiia bacterium]